jgi:hypothetical protein
VTHRRYAESAFAAHARTRFFIACDVACGVRQIRCALNHLGELSGCYQQGFQQKLWITAQWRDALRHAMQIAILA